MVSATIEELSAVVAGQTVPRRFLETLNQRSDVTGLRAMAGDSPDAWDTWTWGEIGVLVARAAAGLQHHGVQRGQRVLLLMKNRPEFHWLDLAIQFLGATAVSIYNSSAREEITYLALHSEAQVAIVDPGDFVQRVQDVRADLPDLRTVFVLGALGSQLQTNEAKHLAHPSVLPYEELLAHGSADLVALADQTDPNDLATVIYTSGTTGPPKGVMLTQYNIVYTIEQLRRCLGFDPDELSGIRIISYLPMAHIAERMNSHYLAATYGLTVTTCPEVGQIAAYAREVRPEMIFGVPRVWEKVHAGVNAALAADPEKQARFQEGLDLALSIKADERAGVATKDQLETWAFLDAVAFSTVRQLVGLDAVRIAISGAAPLGRDVLEWFNAVGVPLSEIYGMSESSGPMTWAPHAIKPGTVGPAIPGCEVRLGDDGEVMCRGGNVFAGYLKDPKKTAEAIIDGWLHSGDIGEIDEDGYLRIVDRKKELIITAGGKNISPANLEGSLKAVPLIGQAAAIGDGRRFVSAVLVLDPELAPAWAARNGLADLSLPELAAHPDVLAEVQRGVDEVNKQFAPVEQIRRFVLVGDEWLPDSDLLTPTSKLKRRGVLARYGAVIEELYA
jgi:long-chain acyl-CoA synthetase